MQDNKQEYQQGARWVDQDTDKGEPITFVSGGPQNPVNTLKEAKEVMESLGLESPFDEVGSN